jgi:beta-phosphoglucomutase
MAGVAQNSIKAIVFDLDGVLIDNAIGYYLDWHWALGQQGYELTPEQFWSFMDKHELAGMPGADKFIVQFCCSLLGRDCKQELLESKKNFSRALHEKGFPPIESTVRFLKMLAQEREHYGYKLGLASGNSYKHILANLCRLGIEKCFDVVVSGSDDLSGYADPEGTNKPKPYIYLHVAKLLATNPAECVAIEDSKTGVSSAINAGYKVVAIPNVYTARQNLSCAHLRIESFNGISPDHFLQIVANVAPPNVREGKVYG